MINTQESLNFLLNRLDYLRKELLDSLNNLKRMLFTSSANVLTTKATEIQEKLKTLGEITKPTPPNWIKELDGLVKFFKENPNSPQYREGLYNSITKYLPTIEKYDWIKAGIDIDFDFEEIYKKYKKESKIDKLFGDVTEILEKILQDENTKDKSEKINILIAIIKNNQNKSCYADDGIINSIYNFLIEIGCLFTGISSLAPLIIQLKDILKELITAYKTTKESTEKEIRERTQMNFSNSVYLQDGSIKLLEDKLGNSVNVNA